MRYPERKPARPQPRTFLGDRPRGPILGAREEAAPTSPPVARTYTCGRGGAAAGQGHAGRCRLVVCCPGLHATQLRLGRHCHSCWLGQGPCTGAESGARACSSAGPPPAARRPPLCPLPTQVPHAVAQAEHRRLAASLSAPSPIKAAQLLEPASIRAAQHCVAGEAATC